MLGFGRGETSPVPSAESAVHSSNPPSTRGPDGTMPRYPTVRVPGVSPRPTTAAPIPKGWRGGSRGANGSPAIAGKAPPTVGTFVSPPPVLIAGEGKVTSRPLGPPSARGGPPS